MQVPVLRGIGKEEMALYEKAYGAGVVLRNAQPRAYLPGHHGALPGVSLAAPLAYVVKKQGEIENLGVFKLLEYIGEERMAVLILALQPLYLPDGKEGVYVNRVDMVKVVLDAAAYLPELRYEIV